VPLPDFVISTYRFEPSGQNVRAYATLLNSGNKSASFQTGQTMAVLSVRGSSYTCYAPGGGYYVEPGKSVELSQVVPSVPPGTYPATWTANPNKVIVERSFENNALECQLVVSPPPPPPTSGPDLVVSITIQPPTGPPSTIFEFQITVTNQGDAVAPASTSQLCRNFLDGTLSWDQEIHWSPYTNLSPGQSIVHIARTKNPLAPGTHEFKSTVDPDNQLVEKDENNNTRSVQFTVQ
jgi:subtilase family serine protease